MDNATLSRLVMIAILALLPFAAYHARHVIWPRKADPPPPAEYPGIIERFQHRRRIFLTTLAIVFAMFAYLFALLSFGGSTDGLLWLSRVAQVGIAFGVMALAIGVGSAVYRCPWCRNPPWAPMPGGKGVSLDPEVCPTCGSPLK